MRTSDNRYNDESMNLDLLFGGSSQKRKIQKVKGAKTKERHQSILGVAYGKKHRYK